MAVYRSRHTLTGPLTPDRIAAVALPRTRLGRRGYEPDHVHALLYRLAQELHERGRQLDLAQAENHRIKHALHTWQTQQAGSQESWRGRLGVDSGRNRVEPD
ncbi:DivIVA domain-containing protein [Micromonospora sp. NBC_00858]|uniref:DivIVA domain-containing protein n=1 Tax=Micromonospora sp. NBC_00858 TaxID=2975979 RepID=UPI0038707EDE|nr:DivIVA domain-containing protein [Micromonospora sp. NBC_00858]